MLTSWPVRGLRPMPVLRGFTLNTPNRRSSMRCPRPRAFFSVFEHRLNRFLGLRASHARLGDYRIHDVELDHSCLRFKKR